MKRELYQKMFKGKKITIMGLGVLGRGLQITKFMASCGAKITVTDLKNKKDLAVSLKSLRGYKIRYVLGKHDLRDFENVDLLVKSAGVPLESEYIFRARSVNIPVVMDASLFAEIVKNTDPKIKIVGITGTRGKSMTTALIYHILKDNESNLKCKVYLGGNMRMKATLPILYDVEPGDIVVLELDSWQCQGFGDGKISPDISVFTNLMPDHMNYYKGNMKQYLNDKSNIYKFQTKQNVFITSKEVLKILPIKPKGKVILPDSHQVSKIKMNIFGTHNIQNATYAYSAVKQFKLSERQIRKSFKSFSGLEGRLQPLANIKGAKIINDNNATTPEATTAGINAVHSKYKKSDIILICGGSDKNLELKNLADSAKKYCKEAVLLPGTGTGRLKPLLKVKWSETPTLKLAVKKAVKLSKKNDVILFSPGFASFGLFKNEYDRNDQLIEIVKKWK